MGRPGDERGRLRYHRIMPDDLRMRGELAQRDRGADLERVLKKYITVLQQSVKTSSLSE